MSEIHALLQSPWTWFFVGWYVLSIVASALPTPRTDDPKGYKFVYALFHGISGSLVRLTPILSSRYPMLALLFGVPTTSDRKIDEIVADRKEEIIEQKQQKVDEVVDGLKAEIKQEKL